MTSGFTPGDLRRFGRRGPRITRLGLGCAALGNLFSAVSDADARATVDAAWQVGIRFFDTAPLYGHGLSERRLGEALRGRPRGDFVVATKVGRLLVPAATTPESIFVDVPSLEPVFDFSREATLASIEASLERLGLDRLDVVHVHDPDDHAAEALAGAFPALCALRDQGVIGAVGCGMNQVGLLRRFVDEVDLDGVLLAGRYTLLDRAGADELLPVCHDRGIAVVLGGVFNSGILADPDNAPTFDYRPAQAALVERARAMRDVCQRRGITLPAAALQFALGHPGVTSVIVGARSAEEIVTDAAWMAEDLPDDLWEELDVAGDDHDAGDPGDSVKVMRSQPTVTWPV